MRDHKKTSKKDFKIKCKSYPNIFRYRRTKRDAENNQSFKKALCGYSLADIAWLGGWLKGGFANNPETYPTLVSEDAL